ncbi:hypothetical protein [Jeotgalibacillus aurantiacus]|uniref:hypothetical protein n=1 Tax=Jeotgalibacillus aurantiacus TaxID=2763266 RepID=UPI001D0A7A5E|nr:hypothetical protein [Jeotgalibacillus aurantiacus]
MSDQLCQVVIIGKGNMHQFQFHSFTEALSIYEEIEDKYAKLRIRNRGEVVQRKEDRVILKVSPGGNPTKTPKLLLPPEEWFSIEVYDDMLQFAETLCQTKK